MVWFILHLFVCMINGAICSVNGYHVDTWQFWFWVLAVALSFIFGRAYEDGRR